MIVVMRAEDIHNVPSTSKTMPLSTGLSSLSFPFAGFNGANRLGRIGCVMELFGRTKLMKCKRNRDLNVQLLPRFIR